MAVESEAEFLRDGQVPGQEIEEEFDMLSLVRAPVAVLTPEEAARKAKLARARAIQAERDATGQDVNLQMKQLLADSRMAADIAAKQLARGATSGIAFRKGST